MNINTTTKAMGFILSVFALMMLFTNSANAADCGNDPIYERDMYGQTNVGSRVRNWACMEDSEILTVLPLGTKVHIIGETDGWYKVSVGDKVGWVGARLIDATGSDQSSGAVVTTPKPTLISAPVSVKIIGIDEANFAKLESGNNDLRNRLKNMVVLRVNFHGKAYLVQEDGTLKFLTAEQVNEYKKGTAIKAKEQIQAKVQEKVEFGQTVQIRKLVGIDEANFAKLEAGDLGLRTRLMNQIVLRVNYHGKAYLVNPNGGLKFLEKNEIGNYLTTTPSTEAKAEPESESKTETQEMSQSGSISLEGQLTDPGKVKLSWSTAGLDASKGFKVVISQSPNPVYPGNDYHYLTSPSVRQDYWTKLAAGKTYHFRVCQYLDGKCGVYSNDVAVTVETNGAIAENVMPGSINLNVSPIAGGKADISWDLTDMTSPKGFKIVIDDEVDPVYPGNDYHYLTDPEVRSDVWTGLTAGKTYHFRVCEYLGGYCGTYSNDVMISAQ
ncbi:SH3 domain-containing protein [Patescibacteria group bacterium]|nr:SH3 domain-containing protein [Patescibacteria group bacterium]